MVNNANFPFVPGQGGRLALDRFDAQAHFTGTGFRHTADQINTLTPSLIINGDTTVEQALQDLSLLPGEITALGVSYISIPDGYNAWINANGTINIDPTIPFLDTFLNPIFAMITANETLPPAYARLQDGGVMFIPAGTYMVNNTINVPPGITLLGEGFGTKLVNVSSLALPATPGVVPNASPISITNASSTTPIEITLSTSASTANLATGQTVIITGVGGNTAANNTSSNPYWTITVIDNQHFTLNNSVWSSGAYTSGGSTYFTRPVLNILSDTNRVLGGYTTDKAVSGSATPFMFARATNIVNLVISDNFVEPAVLGDTDYTIPQNFTNSTFTAPALITQQQGSNLVLENVVGIGRIKFSSGTVVSSATSSFINTSSPALPSGAVLGTYLKVNNCLIDGFAQPIAFAGLGGSLDFISITNSKIKTCGYFGGNSSLQVDNTILNTSDANIVMSNNSLFGNAANVSSAVDLSQVAGSVPNVQAKSKVVFACNDVQINKASNTSNTSFSFFDTGVSNFLSYISIAGYPIPVNHSVSPYTADAMAGTYPSDEQFLMCDTSTGTITINLPDSTISGHKITIKDVGGEAITNNITITPLAGQTIEGGAGSASYVYASSYGSITLTSYAGGWWLI